MPFPPNLFLIGAQKAGTTYLATLLDQHPDICLASPKEPDFFTRNWAEGETWYRERFSSPDSPILLDASTSYSAAPENADQVPDGQHNPIVGVPGRIAAFAPDARFIYLMRDPVKRAYSSYWHAVRGGYEHLPFREALHNHDRYLRMGRYYQQLQHYFEHFDRDRFLLLFFEDFIKEPATAANQCLSWLGLEATPDFQLAKGKNETYAYGPVLMHLNKLLAGKGGLKWLTHKVRRFVPHQLLRTMRKSMTQEIPPLDPADRDWLAAYFEEPNRRLEDELGLTLPGWTRP